ncbi:MAG: ankyrin repeat domain-containing protein [Alphaproteobacteria bacterium]
MALEPMDPKLTELFTACATDGGAGKLRQILAESPDAAHWGEERKNRHLPVHAAASNGRLEQLKMMDDAGADLNFLTDEKMTLLHLAAQGGHFSTVKWLVEKKGFDIHAIDDWGYNVMRRAACCGTLDGKPVDTVLYLLRRGARTDVPDKQGRDTLTAAKERHIEDGRPNLADVVQKFLDDKARAQIASIGRKVKDGIDEDLPVRKPLAFKPK